MKSNKIVSMKVVMFAVAVAAAAVVAAGAVRADEIPPGANRSHDPNLGAVTSTKLTGKNFTSGCVRVYANGMHDVQSGRSFDFGAVAAGKDFMASVFKGGCGGTAARNVWFRASGAVQTNWWGIR